ncbi:uncharacterized protein LOC130773469 [Actinidia eriantha]|uniref:uncharacterized protein LOC130773469 n=1 Tax=Actinidia eriantha TaxID=165200 RepID=UPI002588542A|nr:uncharacterized protein LOC130773469 [Actinidia eriantha]
MEPHGSSGTKAEAERWLLIAEKLLAGRDLVGSKTFAIRARDAEPRLEAAEQILAVADTLIAGEKRIDCGDRDWYAVLQLPHLADDPDLVAAHYRRLAVLLNPHRNRLSFADHAMKLVSDAWSVLSNPSKKSLYDNELVLLSNLVQEPQEQEQPQNAPRKSPRNVSNHNNKSRNVEEESEIPNNHDVNSTNNHDVNSTFWTACPYCYSMYEYTGIYVDCSLRCQNCQRAFHGTKILEPPPIVEGKEMYFCCWGFYPLGVSSSKSDKNKGGVSSWSPFSPMFSGPQLERRDEVEDNVNVAGQMNVNNAGKNSEPRIYIDDQDVYVEISESDGESDDDWGSTRPKKKTKTAKEKSSTGKNVKKPQAEKVKNVKVGSGNDLQGGYVMQEFMGAPNVLNAEASRKVAANNPKKFPKQWGRLDLNVEFSNEVEESAPGMSRVNAPGLSRGIAPGMTRGIAPGMNRGNAPGMGRGNGAGNGEEDGIEGIGFFEGLDEFLSSLPILKS